MLASIWSTHSWARAYYEYEDFPTYFIVEMINLRLNIPKLLREYLLEGFFRFMHNINGQHSRYTPCRRVPKPSHNLILNADFVGGE